MKPRILAIVGLASTLAFQAQADVILAWNFDSAIGNETSFVATTVGANVSTAGDNGTISLNGLAAAEQAGAFGSNTWPAGFDSASFYIDFIVAPTSGFSLSLESIEFNIALGQMVEESGAAPPQFFEFYSSEDDFEAVLETFDFIDPENYGKLILGPEFQSLAINEVVTFRLYAYGGDPASFAVLKKTGEDALIVNSVPEPSTYAMMLVGLGAMAFMHVRQRKLAAVRG